MVNKMWSMELLLHSCRDNIKFANSESGNYGCKHNDFSVHRGVRLIDLFCICLLMHLFLFLRQVNGSLTLEFLQ